MPDQDYITEKGLSEKQLTGQRTYPLRRQAEWLGGRYRHRRRRLRTKEIIGNRRKARQRG